MSAGVTASPGLDVSTAPAARHRSAGRIDDLAERFAPRDPGRSWAATELDRAAMERLVRSSPLLDGLDDRTRRARLAGLGVVVDWLAGMPGVTWQQRWHASGAQAEPRADWRSLVAPGARISARAEDHLGSGLLLLICSDVVRPSVGWLLTSPTPRRMAGSLARARDVEGFAKLGRVLDEAAVSVDTSGPATSRVAAIVAAKGGGVCDITVGDCLDGPVQRFV